MRCGQDANPQLENLRGLDVVVRLLEALTIFFIKIGGNHCLDSKGGVPELASIVPLQLLP